MLRDMCASCTLTTHVNGVMAPGHEFCCHAAVQHGVTWQWLRHRDCLKHKKTLMWTGIGPMLAASALAHYGKYWYHNGVALLTHVLTATVRYWFSLTHYQNHDTFTESVSYIKGTFIVTWFVTPNEAYHSMSKMGNGIYTLILIMHTYLMIYTCFCLYIHNWIFDVLINKQTLFCICHISAFPITFSSLV